MLAKKHLLTYQSQEKLLMAKGGKENILHTIMMRASSYMGFLLP
jgi:hypothetical protein